MGVAVMSYVIDKLNEHARNQGNAIAVSSRNEFVTYAGLARRVSKLAYVLEACGYQCIGLLADNSVNWAVIDLACMQAGVCCIPVPAFFSRQQIDHVLQSAGIQAVVGDAELIAACGLDHQSSAYRDEAGVMIHEIAGNGGRPNASVVDVAKVTFTSGSTGSPKGVCLSLAQIENTVKALDRVVGAGTSKRHLSVLPLVTLLENVAGLYLSLVQGAEILLYPMAQIGFTGLSSVDEKRFFETLETERPQSLILVPELLRLLMLGVADGRVSAARFRFIAVGGGKVSETLLGQASRLGLPVLQGYGLSECASVVSLNGLQNNRPGSVGKPLQHVEVKVADDGEILIAGNLMQGYLGDVPRSHDWFPSGDIGYLDEDGYLYVTGRKKNLLVTSFGKNISPEWVESVFLQSPLIRQLVVSGEASAHLRAVIVPSTPLDDRQLAGLVSELNQQLPEYARVREYQVSVTPFLYENGFLTANGRLKRDAINSHFA